MIFPQKNSRTLVKVVPAVIYLFVFPFAYAPSYL